MFNNTFNHFALKLMVNKKQYIKNTLFMRTLFSTPSHTDINFQKIFHLNTIFSLCESTLNKISLLNLLNFNTSNPIKFLESLHDPGKFFTHIGLLLLLYWAPRSLLKESSTPGRTNINVFRIQTVFNLSPSVARRSPRSRDGRWTHRRPPCHLT